MLNVFWWLITVEAIGLATFPLAYHLLPRLRDRGYSVSKPLGILLIGYASWMLGVLHIVPSVRLTLVGLLLVLGAFSAWYAWRHREELLDFVVRERTAILVGEAVFLAMFLVWVVYRAYDPSISSTEKPMDFGFLNAAMRSVVGQPEDPWLRGESVSYYYFGYWMMGSIGKMTGVISSVSYNLSLALIPALGAMGIFGLVYNLVRTEAARLRYAIAGGLLAALLLGIAANLEGVLEFMRANSLGSQGFWDWIAIDGLTGPVPAPAESWHPEQFWWWWRATRVINTFDGGQGLDYTIEEFPFFSFILGDLHPHVISIPFVMLFLALCLNFVSSPLITWTRRNLRAYIPVLVLGLVLGGLGFTNVWDLPIFAALFLGVAAVKTYSVHGGGVVRVLAGTLPVGGVVIGLALLLFLPYYLTFNSQFDGIHAVTAATTRPVHLVVVWALALVGVIPFILAIFWSTTLREDWGQLARISLLVGFVPFIVWAVLDLGSDGGAGRLFGRFFHVLPFALLVSIAVYNALWLARANAAVGRVFTMVLAALGLLLIMGPELLFVGDHFGTRMNTVFKLYYQAWIVLAAVCGFVLYYWSSLKDYLSGWKRHLASLWAGVFLVLLVGALYYPPAAAASKGDLFHDGATLDGLAFVAGESAGEYEAIRFVRENVDRNSAILEAVGGDYSAFGRISASTGVPTVLGWPGHELQWRGSASAFDGREADVASIYQTLDAEEAKTLLAKYDVDYVYVGRRERDKYGTEGLDKFSNFMEVVFQRDEVVIYRSPDAS